MRKLWFLCLLVLLPASPAAALDGKALTAVGRLLHVIGDPLTPYRVNEIRFTFAVEVDGEVRGGRRHAWYPPSGDHRIRFKEREGTTVDVAWNLHTREGTAARDGVELAGAELDEVFDSAWRMWVNDTYWLLMPFKLLDPGVDLDYDGEVTEDGRTWDRVKVTFDNVGLTPGDTYWAWIDRETGRMTRWSFVLQGREPPESVFEWSEQAYYGPLLLSPRKRKVGANQVILTNDIIVR